MLKYVLFDLDGTLTDPSLGITNSLIYALKFFGISPKSRNDLYKFIGPPLVDSFEEYYGFSKEKAELALKYYRQYFAERGLLENEVYGGIKELLAKLFDNGLVLAVATSKPTVFAKRILEHFDLAKYFTFICGSQLDGTRIKKGEVIKAVLDELKIEDKSSVVMVGDKSHDIIGAKQNDIASIGVLYGFGNFVELNGAKADYIVNDINELGNLVLDILTKQEK